MVLGFCIEVFGPDRIEEITWNSIYCLRYEEIFLVIS